MNSHRHIINRQVFDIRLRSRDKAYQIQNRVNSLYHTQILKVLDEVCSDLVSPNEIIRFDKLEIDLGAVSLTHLEEQLTEKVRKCFYEELFTQKSRIHLDTRSRRRIPGKREEIYRSEKGTLVETKSYLFSQEDSDLELIEHFLKTGALPWWSQKPTSSSVEKLFLDLLKDVPERIQSLLKATLLRESSRQRLVYQFSDIVLERAVELLQPGQQKQVQNWRYDIERMMKETAPLLKPTSEYRLLFWETILASARRQGLTEERKLLQFFIELTAQVHQIVYPVLVEQFQTVIKNLRSSRYTFQTKIPELLKELMDDLPSPKKKKTKKLSRTKQTKKKESHQDLPEVKEDSLQQVEKITEGEHAQITKEESINDEPIFDEGEIEREQIYIENSGLVLLWPFLNSCFKELGVLEENKFIDESSQIRAIHLLQFLVTGEEVNAEFLLPLRRIPAALK